MADIVLLEQAKSYCLYEYSLAEKGREKGGRAKRAFVIGGAGEPASGKRGRL